MADSVEVCYFCPTTFSDRSEINQHCNLYHSDLICDKWLACNDCNNYYPIIEDLEFHQQSVHDVKGPFADQGDRIICHYCADDFTDKTEYCVHARQMHPDIVASQWQRCDACFEYYPSSKSLKSHKSQVHGEKTEKSHKSEKNLMCQFCSKAFRKMKVYVRHANSNHQKDVANFWIICPDCRVYFPDNDMLIHHKERSRCIVPPSEAASNSQVFQCQFCSIEFNRLHSMIKHANNEHRESVSENWLPCDECQTYFPTTTSLQSHSETTHQEMKEDEDDMSDFIRCNFCQHASRTNAEFYKHANRKHLDLISLDWHPCDTCSIFFPTKSTLNCHINNSHNASIHANSSQNCTNLQGSVRVRRTRCFAKPETFSSSTKRHKCSFCNMSFSDSTRYYNHANQDHVEEISTLWHKCDECYKFLPSLDKLKIHAGKMHSSNEQQIRRALLSATEGFSCQFCLETFKKQSLLFSHANSLHREQVKKEWVACGICDEFLPTWKVLKRHRQFSHANNVGQVDDHDDSFNENLDSELDSKSSNAAGHSKQNDIRVKTESGQDSDCFDLPLKVNLKEETDNDKDDDLDNDSSEAESSEEVVMDMDPNEIKTEMMDEDFSDEDEDDQEEAITIDLNGSKNFNCPKCGKIFGRMEFLKRHILRIHTVSLKVDCDMCGKKFKRMETLHKHKRSVHLRINRHKCNLCEKCFADNFALTQHVKSVHANVKYDCELCGKSFTSKGYIKRHTDLVHLKNRNFDCGHCGQAFSENHVLKRHILAVHLKHRNFECDKCGQTFSENHVLKRHIQSVHLKQRNHECEQCGRSFSESHVLKRHIQSVHLKQRNYNCEKCGQTFSENHVLKRHMMAVHAGQIGSESQNVSARIQPVKPDHSEELLKNYSSIPRQHHYTGIPSEQQYSGLPVETDYSGIHAQQEVQ